MAPLAGRMEPYAPTMAAAARGSPLVGREAEIGRLEDALAMRDVCPGLFVAGEAGIGKTRLVEEFASRATGNGVLVTWGGCLESGADRLPFAPFVEALGRLHEQVGDESALFGGADRDELRALIPDLGPRAAIAPDRIRLFEAVRGLFDRVPNPSLLVLEDIHWADRSSLELLSYLVRRLRHGRTLLVASFRSDEVVGGHPAAQVIAELDRTGRAQRVDLPALGSAEIARLVRDRVPAMTPDAAARIAARSEGNAYFAEALAMAPLSRDDGLPDTLRDLLLRRVTSLSAAARVVLDLVALAGRPVSAQLMEAAWEGTPRNLERGLAEAEEHGLLVASVRTIGLRHALVGEAVEAAMPSRTRARLHERLATIFAERADLGASTEAARAAELARHWLCAGRDTQAFAASLCAASAATAVPAWAEARAHYQRALDLWDRVVDHGDPGLDHAGLLECAAVAAAMAGDAEAAVDLQRRAVDETDASSQLLLASRYVGLVRWLVFLERPAEITAAAERAIALAAPAPPGPDRANVLFCLATARVQTGRYRDCVRLAREAAAMAADSKATSIEAGSRAVLGIGLWNLGDEDAAIDELHRAVALAEQSDDGFVLLAAHCNLCYVLTWAGHMAAAAEALRALRQSGERRDTQRSDEGYERQYEATALFAQGRWDECSAAIEAWLAGGLDPMSADSQRCIWGRIRVARGLVAEGGDDLRAGMAGHLRCHDPARHGYIGLVEAAIVESRPRRALEIVDEGVAFLGEEELWPVVYLHVLGIRAAADLVAASARRTIEIRNLAREAGARHVHELDLAASGRLLQGMTVGATIRRLSIWGTAEARRLDGRSDPACWEAAAGALEGWIAPHEAAYARYRQAEALLATRERAAACEALREAHRRACDLGLAPLLEQIRSLSRRGRVSLTPGIEPAGEPPAANPYRLSAREREVLALLVEGRTNREIGETLFITDKTASVHVTHILDKLGVDSRGAAAALAARAGLVRGMPVSSAAEAPCRA